MRQLKPLCAVMRCSSKTKTDWRLRGKSVPGRTVPTKPQWTSRRKPRSTQTMTAGSWSTPIGRHVGQIARLVLEALNRLLRKDRLVTDVHIDPASYTVELIGSDGQSLAATELSAGERQLLAVALLWGLAQAAGQPLPMVIDTPLGRLDGTHRGRLIERYFPHAAHQVVLLSTDTEVDEGALNSLRPFVGRMYRLKFDTAVNATTVQPGYFWE